VSIIKEPPETASIGPHRVVELVVDRGGLVHYEERGAENPRTSSPSPAAPLSCSVRQAHPELAVRCRRRGPSKAPVGVGDLGEELLGLALGGGEAEHEGAREVEGSVQGYDAAHGALARLARAVEEHPRRGGAQEPLLPGVGVQSERGGEVTRSRASLRSAARLGTVRPLQCAHDGPQRLRVGLQGATITARSSSHSGETLRFTTGRSSSSPRSFASSSRLPLASLMAESAVLAPRPPPPCPDGECPALEVPDLVEQVSASATSAGLLGHDQLGGKVIRPVAPHGPLPKPSDNVRRSRRPKRLPPAPVYLLASGVGAHRTATRHGLGLPPRE
jgi:hypothetical protein